MSEGAAQKFDVKKARILVIRACPTDESVGQKCFALAVEMRHACDRIEALEKLVGLAVEWLRQVDHGTNCHQEDAACLAFRKALEGSPK